MRFTFFFFKSDDIQAHKITQNSRSVAIILGTYKLLYFFPYITTLECINHYFILLQGALEPGFASLKWYLQPVYNLVILLMRSFH